MKGEAIALASCISPKEAGGAPLLWSRVAAGHSHLVCLSVDWRSRGQPQFEANHTVQSHSFLFLQYTVRTNNNTSHFNNTLESSKHTPLPYLICSPNNRDQEVRVGGGGGGGAVFFSSCCIHLDMSQKYGLSGKLLHSEDRFDLSYWQTHSFSCKKGPSGEMCRSLQEVGLNNQI